MAPWTAAVGAAAGVVVLLIASRRWPAPDWPGERAGWSGRGRGLLLGLAAGLGGMAAIELTLALLGVAGLRRGPWPPEPGAAAGWALTALLIAGAQEGWMRGWALAWLTKRWGFWRAATVTSGAFVLLHAEPGVVVLPAPLLLAGAAGLFLFGLAAAASVRASGSIAWAAGAHAGWDYVGGFLIGAPAYGWAPGPGCLLTLTPRGDLGWLAGGAFGPEASPAAILMLGAAACAWLRARPGRGASH
ncbi:MAG TPA: CPBP family intramembrane glutamic endopeptidase [Caulobacteraceae bacterium]|nr:CPBP family intramembrane glutamic endopeptidase [Caulobacteraceae bacterium]